CLPSSRRCSPTCGARRSCGGARASGSSGKSPGSTRPRLRPPSSPYCRSARGGCAAPQSRCTSRDAALRCGSSGRSCPSCAAPSPAGRWQSTCRAYRRGERLLPPRAIIITFDDGYRSNRTIALPLLRQYGFGATIFLVTAQLGKTNAWDRDELKEPLLDAADIRSMQAEGRGGGGGIDFG